MSVDWDTLLLAPVMEAFGEGDPVSPLSLPTYHPADGGAFQLPGAVFDAAYLATTELGDGSAVSARRPVLGVRAALFASPPEQGDAVYVPSVAKTFVVTDPRPDGHGHILLILVEAEA